MKIWAIANDSRGVHTFYTEPEGSRVIYYFKPLVTDFNNDSKEAFKYVTRKVAEKKNKGYDSLGSHSWCSSTRTFQKK